MKIFLGNARLEHVRMSDKLKGLPHALTQARTTYDPLPIQADALIDP